MNNNRTVQLFTKLYLQKNTFNMRQVTLMNLAASHLGAKNNNILSYANAGCITSSSKSLDILRKNLQSAINRDIDNVIKKYLEVENFLLLITWSKIFLVEIFSTRNQQHSNEFR